MGHVLRVQLHCYRNNWTASVRHHHILTHDLFHDHVFVHSHPSVPLVPPTVTRILRYLTRSMGLIVVGSATFYLFSPLANNTNEPDPPNASQTIIRGSPYVIDGDTLDIDGSRIRLLWIDACEMGQTAAINQRPFDCGAWSRDQLIKIIENQEVTCHSQETDRYNRHLSVCRLPDTTDIGLAHLRQGASILFSGREGPPDYVLTANRARISRQGVWSFSNVLDPTAYRRRE